MKEEIKKELQNLHSTSIPEKQTNLYQVPSGYFDQLPDQVWQRIQQKANQPKSARIINLRILKITAYAASLIIGGLIIYRLWLNPAVPIPAIHELSQEEIEKYLLDNSEYFETEDLTPWLIDAQDEQATEDLNLPFESQEVEEFLKTENLEIDNI